jgi:inosine/xanthosine triphosphate pyrophosphatase family protein
MTTAEMAPEQKNRISHRGQAFRGIRPAVERALAAASRPSKTTP